MPFVIDFCTMLSVYMLHILYHQHITIMTECPSLSDPVNGMINCTLRVGVPTEGDTCSYTCNDDYELTGNEMRTCQSDGSWSGDNDVCSRGVLQKYLRYLVFCNLFVFTEFSKFTKVHV